MVWSPLSLSDANDGELGGYKLGDRYSLAEDEEPSVETCDQAIKYIIARRPIMPPDMRQVFLLTTCISHTILSIGMDKEFRRDEINEAKEFARMISRLLGEKYNDWEISELLLDDSAIGEDDTSSVTRMSQDFIKSPYELSLELKETYFGFFYFSLDLSYNKEYLLSKRELIEWEFLENKNLVEEKEKLAEEKRVEKQRLLEEEYKDKL